MRAYIPAIILPALLLSTAVRAEDPDFLSAALTCRTGLSRVVARGGISELDFRAPAERLFLLHGQNGSERGFFLFSPRPSVPPAFFSYHSRLKGSGWSYFQLKAQVPGLSPAFLGLPFQDAQPAGLSQYNPEFVNQENFPAETGVTAPEGEFEFSLKLNLSRTLGSLPQVYLDGATDYDHRYCIPRSRFLEAVESCTGLEDLRSLASRVSSMLKLIQEVNCER